MPQQKNSPVSADNQRNERDLENSPQPDAVFVRRRQDWRIRIRADVGEASAQVVDSLKPMNVHTSTKLREGNDWRSVKSEENNSVVKASKVRKT